MMDVREIDIEEEMFMTKSKYFNREPKRHPKTSVIGAGEESATTPAITSVKRKNPHVKSYSRQAASTSRP